MSLTVTPDPKILDVGLAIRLCHKNMIIKKTKKKINKKEKTNEEKEKEIELIGLTL